jgi:hypothetical protein
MKRARALLPYCLVDFELYQLMSSAIFITLQRIAEQSNLDRLASTQGSSEGILANIRTWILPHALL